MTHTWGNFSWVSLSTVLASANDSLAKLDRGRIIDERRMRWVAAQRAAGRDPYVPVSLPDASSLLLLGDPGEMDPSQYVLVRDVHACETDALLLMSDVVYPAGNINAWRDAVYLPYLAAPAEAWNVAAKGVDVTPRRRPIFAMPGNHDWYDGLSGFMYHACSAEPLPPVEYSSAGLSVGGRLTRRAWQNPAPPDRPMLEPLRAVAADWSERPKAVPGAMPHQPGPYFAIDVGSVGSDSDERPALRFIIVDTGVDGSIDTEQEQWIKTMLRAKVEPVPKIVVTGKPLISGNVIQDMPVNQPLPEHNRHWQARGLMDLLGKASGCNVIATVAGDVHNAQRVVLAGKVEPGHDDKKLGRGRCTVVVDDAAFAAARKMRLAPVNIVAGGGGAYLSETHTTQLEAGDILCIEGNDECEKLPPEAHHRFPSRPVSAKRFAATVGGAAGLILVLVGIAFAVVIGLTVWQGGLPLDRDIRIKAREISLWHVVGAAYALLVFVGICARAVALWRGRNRKPPVAAGWSLTAIKARLCNKLTVLALGWTAAAGVALALTIWVWDVNIRDAPLLLAGTAVAVAVPLLPLAMPLLQAFPLLQRFVPTRLLLGAVLGFVGAGLTALSSVEHPTVVLLGGLIVAVVGAVFARWAVAKLVEAHDRWAVLGVKTFWRGILVALSLWPVLLIPLLAFIAGHIPDTNGFDALIVLMVLLDLSVILLVVTAFLARTVLNAWRFAPFKFLPLIVVGSTVGGLLVGIFAGEVFGFSDWPKHVGAGLAAEAALLLALTGVVLRMNDEHASHAEVEGAIRWRDLRSGKAPRGLALFRTMIVAAMPNISEIAEAPKPPFHKSFLTVEVKTGSSRTTGVVFCIFGVDDERTDATVAGQEPPTSYAAEPTPGAFLVDELTVQLD